MPKTLTKIFWLAVVVMCLPRFVFAQGGAVAGTVTDDSGAVLPGVTVEVSSPALIEKVRSAPTDGTGQYRITELPPGEYVVTFTLAGFSVVRREGIRLSAGFTAPVNAQLKVGTLEETITVTGEAPIVDVQNVRRQEVMTREIVDAIPSGRIFSSLGVLIPGINVIGIGKPTYQDVGGAIGSAHQQLSIHGGKSGDQMLEVDGMPITQTHCCQATTTQIMNDQTFTETVLEVSGISAESENGGVRVNMIPKEGGNTSSGSLFSTYADSRFQSNNASAELRQQGLPAPNRVKRLFDVSGSLGGRIVRDRLWFLAAYKNQTREALAASYYDTDTTDFVYTPDFSRQADDVTYGWNGSLRLTWQMNQKQKLNLLYIFDKKCECYWGATGLTSPEASWDYTFITRTPQATYQATLSNSLLVEAGVSLFDLLNNAKPQWALGASGPSTLDQSSGYRIRSTAGGGTTSGYRTIKNATFTGKGAVSYVTGSHALKVGGIYAWGKATYYLTNLADYMITVLNGVPTSVTYFRNPKFQDNRLDKLALYVQDQWSVRRLTANLGLRFDWLHTYYPAINAPATRLVGPLQAPGADVLQWTDLSPRLGAAYDVFGDGKTALKVGLSRYVGRESLDLTQPVNPISSTGTLTRTWNDVDGDYVPHGDPLNPAQNGELGPSPNVAFGQSVLTLAFDPAFQKGFGVRPSQWEMSAGVQRELLPGMSANVGYYRRWYQNFTVIDNLGLAPADYDPFCITGPVDARLPGGGGERICGLFDLKPTKIGLTDLGQLRTAASNYGKQSENWNGVDVNVLARLPNRLLLQGGLSTGKRMTDNCEIVTKLDNPGARFCHTEEPFLTQVKFMASYSLPWNIDVAGTFQSIPGNQILATYVATNAVVRPELGRNLASGVRGTVPVPLVQPGTLYEERLNQVDLRFGRRFTAGRATVKGMLDFYNIFNGNTVLQRNTNYGTDGRVWRTPLAILDARLVKFAVNVSF